MTGRIQVFRRLRRALIASALVLLIGAANCQQVRGFAQTTSAKPSSARRSADELRAILANQPDFAASVWGCNVKRQTGTAAVGRLAKRGHTYRIETSPSIFAPGPQGTITPGQIVWLVTPGTGPDDEPTVTAVVPERKAYFTDGRRFEDGWSFALLASPYVVFLSPQWMHEICGLRDVGTDFVNGIKCLKIEAATRNGGIVVFHAAEKLHNLVIRVVVKRFPSVEFGGSGQFFDFDGAVIDLNDVQLDPSSTLFDVPGGFRRLNTPELYVKPVATHGGNLEARTPCVEPSSSGEIPWEDLCEVPEPPAPRNRPPVCSGISAECSGMRSGESCEIRANASDPDGDMLTYTWTATDGQVTIGPHSRTRFDATGLAPGRYVVTATVDDGYGHIVTCSATIEVLP